MHRSRPYAAASAAVLLALLTGSALAQPAAPLLEPLNGTPALRGAQAVLAQRIAARPAARRVTFARFTDLATLPTRTRVSVALGPDAAPIALRLTHFERTEGGFSWSGTTEPGGRPAFFSVTATTSTG